MVLEGLVAQGGGEGAILEAGHLVGLEVGFLVDPMGGHPVDLEVDHLEGPNGGYLEVQVVGSYHPGRQEVAPGEGGRLGQHGNLGQNKIPE